MAVVLKRVNRGAVLDRAKHQLLILLSQLLFHQSSILVVLDLLAFSKCWRFLFLCRARGSIVWRRTRLACSASQREVLMVLRIKLIHKHVVRVTQVLMIQRGDLHLAEANSE